MLSRSILFAMVLCAVALVAGMLGCIRPTVQGGPIVYVLDIKRLVLAVELVNNTSPSETPGQVEVLLENLRDAPNEDVGQHGQTIDEIAKLANDLDALYKQSAPRQQIDDKIKELAKAARRIPGKVIVREKEME